MANESLQWKVSEVLERVSELGIPHFQRGLVWGVEARGALLESLFYDTPCGSFVLWVPKACAAQGVPKVIEQVKPDVLVLTEYVGRARREEFLYRLMRMGYGRVTQTEGARGQNQVLVASCVEHEDGKLKAPEVDEAARTNFRHVFLPSKRLHVVGFRVPHYQSERPVSPGKLVNYWRQLTRAALSVASQKVVFIGDFNVGGGQFDAAGQAALGKLVKAGYRMCAEEGGLDRALVSGSLTVQSFSVIEAAAGYRLAGGKAAKGLSDHPMLVVDVA